MTVILITHNMGVVAEMADTVSVMYLGKVVESAPSKEIFYNPKHPYTKKLLGAVPKFTRHRGRPLEAMKGSVPDAYNIPTGCPFHPRCESFMPGKCDALEPGSIRIGEDHVVSCYLYGDAVAEEPSDE
jgi:peptide/nickel transport system ATP-binding protein